MECDLSGLSIRDAIEKLGTCLGEIKAPDDPWAWSLALVVSLIVAVAALIGVGVTVYQSHVKARSDQLWERMRWGIEASFSSDDDVKMAGLLALERLADKDESKRAGFRVSELDAQLIDDVSTTALP